MGILKTVGKTLGTAALITTGTASAVLKGVSDTVGFELGSELLDAAKDASFNGVRSIWSDRDLDMSKLDDLDFKVGDATRRQLARTAKQAAEIARKNGDEEKYEHYMNQYEMYRDY